MNTLNKTPRTGKVGVAELLEIHERTSEICRAVMRQKNSDYTGGTSKDDPFANFNMSSAFGVPPIIGILLRIGDKMRRIQSFANDGTLRVAGESVFDACEDIVNYAILIKAMCVEQSREHAGKTTCGGPRGPEGAKGEAGKMTADQYFQECLDAAGPGVPVPCEGGIAEEDVVLCPPRRPITK